MKLAVSKKDAAGALGVSVRHFERRHVSVTSAKPAPNQPRRGRPGRDADQAAGPMTDPGVTVSLPPCQPDHPWASIPTADLAHGRCPACGALLDGEMAARMIRARRLVWADLPRLHREQIIVEAVVADAGDAPGGLFGLRQFVRMFLAAHDALERYDPDNPLGAPERGEAP